MQTDEMTFAMPKIHGTPMAKWAYLSLLFSLFYFIGLYSTDNEYSLSHTTVIVGLYWLFVCVFLLCLRVAGKQAILWVVSKPSCGWCWWLPLP